jgi:4-amino-4-deoxy-L-arabinose transferase-like glycosyltransferase
VGTLRIEVLKSIVDRHDLNVPLGTGLKGIDGRDYSWFGIGSVLLAMPFYLMGELLGAPPENAVYVINQLVGAATAALVFLFAVSLGYSKRASLLTAICYGLGTMAWHYAKDTGDHALEAFFILLSFYYINLFLNQNNTRHIFLSFFYFGFSTLVRPTSILMLPSLFLLLSVTDRHNLPSDKTSALKKITVIFLTVAPFIALNICYNFYRFGTPFETGHNLMANRLRVHYFSGTPFMTGFLGLLASPGKGFFFYTPVATLFFLAIRTFSKKHKLLTCSLILAATAYLIFYSKNLYWHGSNGWGPRYLFVITPLLILPLSALFDSSSWHQRPHYRKIVYVMLTVSVIIQLASVAVRPEKYFIYLQTEKSVNFRVAEGNGVQPIIEPPPETYFNWRLSPILTQFGFMREAAQQMKEYQYVEPPAKAGYWENIEGQPWMHVVDFWWVYKYYVEKNASGFVVAILLVFIALYSAVKLNKAISISK